MMVFLRLGRGRPAETAAAGRAYTPLQQQVLRCPSCLHRADEQADSRERLGGLPTVPPLERGCERPPGLLRAPLAAQRAWLGLAIVGRNALGREHSTPGPGGMCRVTGGSGKRLPQQERHGEAPGSQEEASGRGEPHPANVQEQLQACWGRCQAGGRARAGDRVRGGAAGSLCDPGQRASLPGASFHPQMHRHY